LQYTPFTRDYTQRLISGDFDAERHFVDYFSELLKMKLRRTLHSNQAMEDIRQETFLRVFHQLRNKGGLSNPERLSAFVNAVCNNVQAEYYRSVSRYSPMPKDGFDPPGTDLDPECGLVTEERKRCVRQILDELPFKDREILRLIFFEDRAKDDICRTWNVERNYLRVLLHRAKNRFREILLASKSPYHYTAAV